jgi:two-component system response regulator
MSNVLLLVEDTGSDEKLTLLAFKQCGVANEVLDARDGAEALGYLHGSDKTVGQAPGPMPSLVLLDLKLPKVDGLEVLRRIRADERTKLLPVVILTASKEEEDVVNGYSLGANAYVRKPVEFAAFAEAARTLGLFWLLLNESAPARKRASPPSET